MATISEATQLTVTTEERTWRATIETPKSGAYSLSLHRERRTFDSSNNLIGEPVILTPIIFPFAQIQSDQVTVGQTTLTVAQLAVFLQTYFDQKASEV